MKPATETSMKLEGVDKVLEKLPIEDVTIAIFLDVRTQKKNENFPVKIRVTHTPAPKETKQVYYDSTDISLADWKKLLDYKKNSDFPRGNLLEKKKAIYITFNKIKGIIEELAIGGLFTIDELNLRLSKGSKNSVLDAFKDKITDLEKAGRIGTSVWYSCAHKNIKKYMDGKDLKFSQITPDWLNGYHAYLKDEKDKKSDTTVSMYQRALRSIVNGGLKKGVLSREQYPFGEDKYEIPEPEERKMALSEAQLYDVFSYPIASEFEKWRDLWIFSFYCQGVNVNDLLKFKQENIKRTIKGNIIEWQRQKTTKRGKKKPRKIQALITEEMQEIMDKYPSDNDYVFPYLSPGLTPTREREVVQQVCHNVNRIMKKIGTALKIEKLTTYTARHTFASLSREGGVDVYNIKEKLGHSNIKTTMIYLNSLSIDELIKDAAKMPRKNKFKARKIVNNQ